MTHAEYAEYGGFEGSEVIMWLVMRGALSQRVAKLHQNYYLATTTALAVALFADESLGQGA